MSDKNSNNLSQSTSINSNSKLTKSEISKDTNNFSFLDYTDDLEDKNNNYSNYIAIKKTKYTNLNKLELLKNRINNLHQQEIKNINYIESLIKKENKISKIKKEKNEDKKKLNEFKKQEIQKQNLMREKIRKEKVKKNLDDENNKIRKNEELQNKINEIKVNKLEIKNKINNNKAFQNKQKKLMYEKANTMKIFQKDQSKIGKAEKEDQKRKLREMIIKKEEKFNKTIENNIELLEQEEEQCLFNIRQTQILRNKAKMSSDLNFSLTENYQKLIEDINKNIHENKIIIYNNNYSYNMGWSTCTNKSYNNTQTFVKTPDKIDKRMKLDEQKINKKVFDYKNISINIIDNNKYKKINNKRKINYKLMGRNKIETSSCTPDLKYRINAITPKINLNSSIDERFEFINRTTLEEIVESPRFIINKKKKNIIDKGVKKTITHRKCCSIENRKIFKKNEKNEI